MSTFCQAQSHLNAQNTIRLMTLRIFVSQTKNFWEHLVKWVLPAPANHNDTQHASCDISSLTFYFYFSMFFQSFISEILILHLENQNIVKPWSKSWSQQAPKSNKSPPKKEKKKDLDLGLTPKSHGPPTYPTAHTNIPDCSFHPTPPITFKHEGVLW